MLAYLLVIAGANTVQSHRTRGVHGGQNIRINSSHHAVIVLLLSRTEIALVLQVNIPVSLVLIHDAANFRVRAGILQIVQDRRVLRGSLEFEVVAGQVTVSQLINVGATVLGVVHNDVVLGHNLRDLVNDVHLILI